MKAVVIGGGPSGVTFAVKLKSDHPDYEVIIFEAADRPLKRILVSGNGRANFYNGDLLTSDFAHVFDNPYVAQQVLDCDSASETLEFWHSRGLFFVFDQAGRYYPFSNSAVTVEKIMSDALLEADVRVITGERAVSIRPREKKILFSSGRTENYDRLFMAVGGSSYDRIPAQNLQLLDSLECPFLPFEPALCPLKTVEKIPAFLVGCRFHAHLKLLTGKSVLYEESGEILIKKDGLSGIAVFDASLFYQPSTGSKYQLSLDLTQNGSFKLSEPIAFEHPEFFLNAKLWQYIRQRYQSDYASRLTDVRFEIAGRYDFKDSQVSKGGIDLNVVDFDNLTYKRYPSVMFGGEMLNLTAVCGGYNLGQAFITGYKAAKHLS